MVIVFTSSRNIPDKKDDLGKTFLDQPVLKDPDLRKIFEDTGKISLPMQNSCNRKLDSNNSHAKKSITTRFSMSLNNRCVNVKVEYS